MKACTNVLLSLRTFCSAVARRLILCDSLTVTAPNGGWVMGAPLARGGAAPCRDSATRFVHGHGPRPCRARIDLRRAAVDVLNTS
eukprot:258252-Prymnesium_polylepis.1